MSHEHEPHTEASIAADRELLTLALQDGEGLARADLLVALNNLVGAATHVVVARDAILREAAALCDTVAMAGVCVGSAALSVEASAMGAGARQCASLIRRLGGL